jgi:hypothetical protein
MKTEPLLKRLGHNVSFEFAVRLSTSIILRLLVGVIGGLPPNALALNAAISFFLTGFLEFPTGLLADWIGKSRALVIGCGAQALASLCIFAAGRFHLS